MNAFKTMFLLASLTALFMAAGFLIGGTGGMAIAFVFALGTNMFALWKSDKAVLRMHGAKAATQSDAPDLFSMVAKLAQNAGLPMPKVYIIESDQPNAFATGRNPANAAVAVTTGIMRILSRDELAGVIAHELGHIRNRDTLIMTMAATIGGAIAMLAQFGLFFGRRRGRGGFGFIGVILAALLAPFAAMLIQMLISRTREYSADRAGAQISGRPLSLASALAKISGNAKIEMQSVERNPATAHMFIVNPLSGARMDSLFATHPKVENRIAALQDMADESPPPAPQGRKAKIRETTVPTVRRRRRGRWQ